MTGLEREEGGFNGFEVVGVQGFGENQVEIGEDSAG